MENLVGIGKADRIMFNDCYRGKRVLISGHTGFKGSWLSQWLLMLGADVYGYALTPQTDPSHFALLRPDMHSTLADIRDAEALNKCVQNCKPDIVFHLAAQPLVRYSYRNPLETYTTNVIGTLNLYEACRAVDNIRAIVSITTDKVYENREWEWGYRENDALGGFDPYSSSKACAEILSASYRSSYFHPDTYGIEHSLLMATTRAGNVVGGGDWAADRLIPDIVRAAAKGETVILRNPQATRPWQHVLEPLYGYLMLGQQLLAGNKAFSGAWNFASPALESASVLEILHEFRKHWGAVKYEVRPEPNAPHETTLLRLDSSKAAMRLHWQPLWNSAATIEQTALWYAAYYRNHRIITEQQIESYTRQIALLTSAGGEGAQ